MAKLEQCCVTDIGRGEIFMFIPIPTRCRRGHSPLQV